MFIPGLNGLTGFKWGHVGTKGTCAHSDVNGFTGWSRLDAKGTLLSEA